MIIKSNIRNYSVNFTNDFAATIAQHVRTEKCFFIIDRKVFSLYKSKLSPLINQKIYFVDAKEESKTLDECANIIKFLLENNFKRNHKLIAIGGGIVQDLTCFVSSVLFRGVDWIFYPTTLLAQCDSCIGSKSSINVSEYKNQVGTFYPPEKIFIDTAFLKTLSKQEIMSGVGEAIKVHFLDPKGSYNFIIKNYKDAFKDKGVMSLIIKKSLEIKKNIIEADEYDKSYRNILNYGHTFGHAIEAATNYLVPHGIAVTAGIAMANYFSLKKGMLKQKDYDLMLPILQNNISGYENQLANADFDVLLASLRKDKKNVDDRVGFILTKGPGQVFKNFYELKKETKNLIFDSLNSIIRKGEIKCL
tara:strand:+ start:230 stop:1312 length:1083 start_codon:yes stop_codon:yes gene_type:complete